MPNTTVAPFTVQFPEADLAALRERIRATRWPEPETDAAQGVPLATLRELCDHWADGYDWQRCADRLNAVPQVLVEVDGLAVHALHVRSPRADALPLVLTHGWPGSVVEFLDVLGPLSDPEAYGAPGAPAFHLVVPSLPGYGFSGKPAAPGWNPERIADAWVRLMAALGYERFAAQGGDWGAVVSTALGRRHPDRLVALHLNMPMGLPPEAESRDVTGGESERDQRARASSAAFRKQGSGYSAEQATRPQTIGYSLVDSPVGLCAWIVEKLIEWTDNRSGPALSHDQMLDDVTLYWLTATGASAARLYWENRRSREPVAVPTGCSLFPGEPVQVPRAWAERVYTDLRYWRELDHGGHFAAWEQPGPFVAELRAFFGSL